MFGFSRGVNYGDLVKNGAYIVDVRTRNEFSTGHINGSVNIPLNELKEGMSAINKGSVIIICCASGLRSASAKNVLMTMGYKTVFNGGPYLTLASKI